MCEGSRHVAKEILMQFSEKDFERTNGQPSGSPGGFFVFKILHDAVQVDGAAYTPVKAGVVVHYIALPQRCAVARYEPRAKPSQGPEPEQGRKFEVDGQPRAGRYKEAVVVADSETVREGRGKSV